MNRPLIKILALILASIMLLGILASCKNGAQGNEETTVDGGDVSEETTKDNGDSTDETTEKEDVVLDGEYGSVISHSNKLSNAVQSYYVSDRSFYTIENLNMTAKYPVSAGSINKLASLSNKKGGVYIKDTMDAFIETTDGKVYYSSDSSAPARPNVFRIGYYYYDVHLLEQNFLSDYDTLNSKDIDVKIFDNKGSSSISSAKVRKGDGRYFLSINIKDSIDPYIASAKDAFSVPTEKYNAITFSIKSNAASSGQLYFVAGSHTDYTEDQVVNFSFANDGEYHTCTVILEHCQDFTGNITGIRLDLNGAAGEEICIRDIKFVGIDEGISAIMLDKTFHTYSDKLHHELHFVANKTTSNISAVGLITEIAVDTVDKLVVKDANGLHDTLDGVDWNSAEYVGFDIKNVGVFGYILPVHKNSGTLNVTIADGNYVIKQTSSLASQNYTIEAPEGSTDNDYRVGQRIYTDESHDFTAFLQEAEWERHPLQTITSINFVAYDAIRGDYVFDINGSGFNEPFFTKWNYHFSVNAIFESEVDRPIYIRTATDHGTLENAVLLSRKNLVLPVELEVAKNFGFEKEEPIFDAGDRTYGETMFPLYISAGKKLEINILNLYQNWGNFPIKQLSSIQFFVPYYHLSVGTTETSCIMPWYGRGNDLWTLPDFRSISSPYWFELEGDAYSNQPQHTHAGYQYFLQYTDANGNYSASEIVRNHVNSYGPIYAEVDMEYISYDGRIKVTYTHTEMPQTDEHRAYYTIKYEILKDISFTDFSKDFSFYSFKGHSGYYKKMGYLNENNEIVHKNTNGSTTPEALVLGNNHPYVALYDLEPIAGSSAVNNNTNIGFVIANSDITLGGEKFDGNFIITGKDYTYSLSLNVGETTLKAGDTMSIDMVISPWGWYTSTDDTNMQNIRQDSAIDPFTVTVNDGEKIESSFIPKVLSTNGKSAEFTLSGGANNVAVRVYGFEKLTAPKIYELVDGEWVEYVVSSHKTPDKAGNYNYYDGYYVYYDGDGTYSYAFVVNMDNVESRTFKIEAEKDFKKWPAKPVVTTDTITNVFVSANDLYLAASAECFGLKNVVMMEEDGGYVRFYGDGVSNEGYMTVYSNDSSKITGQYIFVKYRVPSTLNANTAFQFFTSTIYSEAKGNGDYLYSSKLVKDNEWHVLVVDIAASNLSAFVPNDDGTYTAKHLRFDVFDTLVSTENYIDVAYIGMADSIEEVCALEESLKSNNNYVAEVVLSQNTSQTATYKTATGEILSGKPSDDNKEDDKETVYIHPDSGKVLSSAPYLSRIDFINGFGDGDIPYPNKGGCSHTPGLVNKVDLEGIDIGAQYLVLSGWTMVYGGWNGILYSVDGGLTWINATLANKDAFGDASSAIIEATESATKTTGFDAYKAGSSYQGDFSTPDKASGVKADLSAYAGQTVNVIFAAASAQNANELCIIGYIENVAVPSAE